MYELYDEVLVAYLHAADNNRFDEVIAQCLKYQCGGNTEVNDDANDIDYCGHEGPSRNGGIDP